MKPNHIKLIKFLLKGPANSRVLAHQMNVSTRSVKHYVKEINEIYPDTISSSTRGYQVKQENLDKISQDKNIGLPQSKSERINYIIFKIINNDCTNIYDLSEELYVSDSTLRKDLTHIKKRLNEFSLHLKQNGVTIYVEGLEHNKRSMLSKVLYEESKINFINLSDIQRIFKNIDVELIQEIALDFFEKHHFYINDYSLINFVLNITLVIDRLQSENTDIDSQHHLEISSIKNKLPLEYKLSQDLASNLSKYFNVNFNDYEIIELTLLIASRSTPLNYKTTPDEKMDKYFDVELREIVEHLVQEANDFFQINLFENKEFLIRFSLHIRSLIVRCKKDLSSKNPLVKNLKTNSPLIYEGSVRLAYEFQDLTGFYINDDEIAYIAFHLGCAIGNIEDPHKKLKVIYYCPNYHNLQSNTLNFIEDHFSEEIMISSIMTDESTIPQLSNENVDFILTSMPIYALTSIPVIRISVFPDQRDLNIIKKAIYQTHQKKNRDNFEKHLRNLLLPELFEIRRDIKNSEDCLVYMSQKLLDFGFVDEHFTKNVLIREKISSTAYQNIAIPHSIKMDAKKTTISILINPNGIQWKDKKVYLVLLMSFNKKERLIFNEIFKPITDILTDNHKLETILTSNNYEELIKNLVDSF